MPESHTHRARERFLSFVRQRYAALGPEAPAPAAFGLAGAAREAARPLATGFRRALAVAYRERARASHSADLASRSIAPAAGIAPAAPRPAPANNWIPIGPSVLRKGQAENRPAVSGRVPGIAVAPGGSRVYLASANGGVWRSDDGGVHWRSTMEAFNLQPASLSSDSLACGAIALHPANPDRVYVGTGEGDSVFIQSGQAVGTGAYFGVGPVRSDDGGATWHTERVDPSSPPLAGASFYQLAVDPADGERVVAATVNGLYRREPDAAPGSFSWFVKHGGIFTSVVASRRGGATVFHAAQFGGPVMTSLDGNAWTVLGSGFPAGDVGRVALGVQPGNPDVVYALVVRASDTHLEGLYRFDTAPAQQWTQVSGVPADLFGPDLSQPGQGSYDAAILVDARDASLVYVGGSTRLSGTQFSASLFRLSVQRNAAGAAIAYSAAAAYIGANVHADVHTLVATPGVPDQLWVGCDGGLFVSGDASAGASFAPRNTGLGTIAVNHIAAHPSEDAVLFCGTQDNGTVRYTGDEAWLHSGPGDGGSVIVNPQDPYTILRGYVMNAVYRATDGGAGQASWQDVSVPVDGSEQVEFYPPIAGAPPGAGNAAGNVVAFGSERPWVSTDFGTTWVSIPNNDLARDRLNSVALSLVFASASKFYVGTLAGGVYRCEQNGAAWTVTALHASPLLRGPVTGLTVDPADASGNSIYCTFGGRGDFRRVWRFDGRVWEARSGPSLGSPAALMDVQHNALVVDRAEPNILYAGADIGVWQSRDAGRTWQPFAEGLPEAAVLDLKLHPARRLLWAATYGRGVYERTVDSATARPVELYVRDTLLDRGRRPSADGLPDPTKRGAAVSVHNGPGIKMDVPDAAGKYQTATAQIDFFQFVDALDDKSGSAATGAGGLVNRVFALVHNRGMTPADGVSVALHLGRLVRGAGPALPAGFDADLRAGHPIQSPDWVSAGFRSAPEIRAGSPEVVEFDLPASLLPAATGPGNPQYCLLITVTSAADPFVHPGGMAEAVAIAEPKAAIKYF